MTSHLLEIIALDADDARAAEAGGADRLEVVTDMASDGLTPDVATVAAIRRACDLPLRVMLRARSDFAAGDIEALIDTARRLVEVGADGFVFGFLGSDNELDSVAMAHVASAVALPWTCHRCVDHARDYRAAIDSVATIRGMDHVLTGGGPSGLGASLSNVLSVANDVPVLAGGGLTMAAVPALVAGGVTGFHVGSAVRRSWNEPVDEVRVAEWRHFLDVS